jgi:hypothetical protein
MNHGIYLHLTLFGGAGGAGIKRPASGHGGVARFESDDALPTAHPIVDLRVDQKRGVQ